MSDTRNTPALALRLFEGYPDTQNAGSTLTARPTDPGTHTQRSARTPRDPVPFSCRDGHRWAGSRTCHCPTCHRSFSGVTHFDRHRRNGECLDPAEIGLTLLAGRAFECWGTPESDD